MLSKRTGLSLVELLVAILVMAAVLGGLFQGIHTGYQGTERLIEESYASNHAISLLEALTLVPYSKLPDIPVGTSDTGIPAIMGAIPEFTFTGSFDPEYPRSVEVIEVSQRTKDPSDSANSKWGALKRISIEVEWTAKYLKPTRQRKLVFQTLVTDDAEVSR